MSYILRGECKLDTSTWIAIYLPMIILFFIILPHQRAINDAVISKIRKKKGGVVMTNELIQKYIGKRCKVSTGSYGINVIGTIINIKENWIEIETKKGFELINLEFIQNIKVK